MNTIKNFFTWVCWIGGLITFISFLIVYCKRLPDTLSLINQPIAAYIILYVLVAIFVILFSKVWRLFTHRQIIAIFVALLVLTPISIINQESMFCNTRLSLFIIIILIIFVGIAITIVFNHAKSEKLAKDVHKVFAHALRNYILELDETKSAFEKTMNLLRTENDYLTYHSLYHNRVEQEIEKMESKLIPILNLISKHLSEKFCTRISTCIKILDPEIINNHNGENIKEEDLEKQKVRTLARCENTHKKRNKEGNNNRAHTNTGFIKLLINERNFYFGLNLKCTDRCKDKHTDRCGDECVDKHSDKCMYKCKYRFTSKCKNESALICADKGRDKCIYKCKNKTTNEFSDKYLNTSVNFPCYYTNTLIVPIKSIKKVSDGTFCDYKILVNTVGFLCIDSKQPIYDWGEKDNYSMSFLSLFTDFLYIYLMKFHSAMNVEKHLSDAEHDKIARV